MSKIKILITEDDPFTIHIYQNKFQLEGFDVTIARDGIAAMRRLADSPPDVVLLDLMLPEINGVEVLKYIRSTDPLRDIPVVVLSSSVAGDLIQAAKKQGADKILTKATCSPNHVVDEVRAVLAARHLQPENDDAEESLRVGFRTTVPTLVAELEPLQQRLAASSLASSGSPLSGLRRAIHTLTSHASHAGFTNLAQMASALEVLLRELCQHPRKVTPCALRTVGQVCDFIPELLQRESAKETAPVSPIILVLDDDVISCEILCAALEGAGLRALACHDPFMALKMTESNRFDLIFLDIDMPRMSGFDVCQKLQGTPTNAETPIVFVTNFNDFETRARFETTGAADFIVKPIVPIELAVKAVMHLLRGRAARSEHVTAPGASTLATHAMGVAPRLPEALGMPLPRTGTSTLAGRLRLHQVSGVIPMPSAEARRAVALIDERH